MTTVTAPHLPPAVATWPTLRELSPGTAHQVFDACLNAVARPGTMQQLPADAVPAPLPAALAPILALVDLMAPLAALPTASPDAQDPTEAAVELVGRLTGARVVSPGEARFALALGEPESWSDLSVGSHWSPEQGATLVQRVIGLVPATPGSPGAWRLTGPGIPPTAPAGLLVDGLGPQWLAQRSALRADYPAGVDCLLVTDRGELVGLPRTTTIRED